MTLQSNDSLVKEIIFIDPTVEDYESLLAGIYPDTKVVILDRMKDGISQITENLQGGTYKAVHIVSHGSEGSLQLGSKQLNSSNLDSYKSQLQQWAKYLTEDADILLYGCDVAAGETGVGFVQQLSQLTGADVAASDDLTGNAALGGDWDLEVKTGKIEAPLAFQVGVMETYNAVLAAFTPGNLVVVRVGNGSASLSSAATAVFLDEFTPNGTLVQSIALPTSDIGSNQTLTISGSAISEGLLNLSPNGQFLTLAGYDANPGTSNVSTTASNIVNRIVARVDATGNIDTTTKISDAYGGSSANIRSAVTDDGTRFWTAGTGTGGGTRYVTLANTGTGTSTLISSSSNNTRVVSIFNGQLYTSSGSGSNVGVNSVGIGLPTTAGQTTTILPGLPNTPANNYSFLLLDRDAVVAGVDTLYVADQSSGSSGGLYKYSFDGTTWSARGSFANRQLTGLTGFINGNSVDLYATSKTSSANTIVKFTDSAAFDKNISTSPNPITLATAGVNTAFRGIAFAPGTVASPTNLAPIINLLSATSSYTENAAPTIIDSGIKVTDTDSPDFNTGILTVRFTAGNILGDRLTINNQGNSAGQIGLDGRIINFGGTRIATFKGGIDSDPLVITFDSAAATPTVVETLLRQINYSNVTENLPAAANRTLEIVLTDGDGGTSNTVTKTINVIGQNDAPFAGNTITLYDGNTNKLPTESASAPNAPWFSYQDASILFGGSATQSLTGSGTKLTTDNQAYAGYINYGIDSSSFTNPKFTSTPLNSAFPILNRNSGYILSFTTQLQSETVRTAGADKNQDAKDDRAGFSVIAISSDKKGIELGFWANRIWAQEDGTTQVNPSYEPDNPLPQNSFRTLFTQAEGATFTTTNLADYDLAIYGETYTLFANSNPILSGRLRDYTAFQSKTYFGVTPPDPYEQPNFIFLGDNTPQAGATVNLKRVAITTNNIPNQTINEDQIGAIAFSISDFETAADSLSITPISSDTTLIPNSNLVISGTGANRTITVTPAANQNGAAKITVNVSDGINTTARSFDLTVNPVNDRPTFNIGANQSVKTGAAQQTIAGWARDFNSGATNETQSVAGYIVNVVNNINADIFEATPTINSAGNLTYTAKSGITASKTATIEVQVQDSGSTDYGGVNTSVAQTFTITVNPTTTNSLNGTPNADTNLKGTDQSDRISGLDSDDIIYGGLGSDRIFGDNGNDTLYGDLETIPPYANVKANNFSMDDTIAGGAGNDKIYGNLGNDKLYGDEGDDQIWGGEGDDQIWGSYGNDTLYGGADKDAFVLVRGQGSDTIMDFTTEDVLGCAGALRYSSLSFKALNGDTLITDTATNQLLATLKGFIGTVSNGGLF